MIQTAAFPEPPIPDDIKPGKGWSKIMIEMAAYIGARDVLRLCERYGGQQVYFPADPAKTPFVDDIGQDKADALCAAYRLHRVTLPTARFAISRARRSGIIAAARARRMTVAQAAAMLHLRHDTVSRLVKQEDEGGDDAPLYIVQRPKDPRQIEMFPDTGGN